MFSATGNLLSGSPDRPDIYTISIKKSGPGYSSTRFISTKSKLNTLGYIPGLSTITGCGRAILGIVHSIVHLASAIFDSKNRAKHLEEVTLGGKNIIRGLVEMIPIIGNITTLVVDLIRINIFQDRATNFMNQNPNEYINQTTLFIYGKEIAKRSTAEVNEKWAELAKTKKLSNPDLINTIKNKA